MIIKIIIICSLLFEGILYFSIVIYDVFKSNMRHEKMEEGYIKMEMDKNIPKFSLVSYFEKIENVTKEIIKNKKNKYTIVLWLLDEGLQINDDGTTKWIKRWDDCEENRLSLALCQDINYNYYSTNIYRLEQEIKMFELQELIEKQIFECRCNMNAKRWI